MKKIFIPLVLVLLVTACAKDDAAIKKQILSKKNQIARIEQQISQLQKELSDSTENIRLIPVEIKDMQAEEFNHFIVVYGKVDADNYALISPEMNGRVKTIHVAEGQYVNKGQLLLSLNTSAIEGQIKATESSLELAEKTFNKLEKLWEQNIGSEIDYLGAKAQKENFNSQLDALKAQMQMAQIRAPFTGTVNKIVPKVGEMAGPAMPVIEFVNLNQISIHADLSEKYIGQVKKGDIVDVSFSSLPDVKKKVKINRASNVINNISRTFEIELSMINPGELIKPNMVSTIHINDYSNSDAYVIPSHAIRKDISGKYVYTANQENGKAIVDKKYIETSKSYDDLTMVTGVSAGDKVIVKGFHMVSSGMPVKIVN